MTVTEIVPLDKKRSKVYIDHEFAFVLYKGELSKYKVRLGENIGTDVYREITTQVLPKRAKLRAMNLLTKRDYTEKQLRDKLSQGDYQEEMIEIALNYVKSFGYINDEKYVESYLDIYQGKKPFGKIKEELLRKGIMPELILDIKESREEYEETDEIETEEELARRWLEKKHYDYDSNDYKMKQKMFGFLLRKGFNAEVISKVLKSEL